MGGHSWQNDRYFSSGARGAYIGVLLSVAVFVAIWSICKGMNNKVSLAPAIVGLTGVVSFAVLLGLITVWKRAHNIVLGGGDAAASNQGRYEQWLAGIPLIESNPITGHGFVNGGYVINSSIDSYVLSLLLRRESLDLYFFAASSCFRSGMACEIFCPTFRNLAQSPGRWPAASSPSPPTDSFCRREKITC